MRVHLCLGCSAPVPHRTLCPACSRKRFEELKETVRASTAQAEKDKKSARLYGSSDYIVGLADGKLEALEHVSVCLSDTAHGGPIPPYACGCAECLRSIGLTAVAVSRPRLHATMARTVAVILALSLAACAHPADARPRHYSADSGSGGPR